MGLIKDFREFVGSGNAIDLAVGVIIGSAMTTILKSFVDEPHCAANRIARQT